jgi:transglutaminase-like putative cysteine protease
MRAHVLCLAILLSVLISTSLNAQFYDDKNKMKFGKVEMDELKMTTYKKDTGASALIIADYGITYFAFNPSKSYFEMVYEQHCRIKVFKTEGYPYADIEIPIISSGGDKETFSNFKASTYNLENGKMVEHKLARKDVFEERVNEDWVNLKFTMPNVKVGSVFEFTYKITSDYQLREWQFQHDIPVAWSEYSLRVPQYYKFLQFSQGHEPFFKYEKKKESASFAIGSHTELYTNEFTYWAVKDAPGLAYEKFITTPEDFATKVDFQLATVQLPRSMVRNYLADWPEVQKKYLEHEKFGTQLNRASFMKNELQAVIGGCTDNICKTERVYNFIRNTVEWNSKRGVYCETNVRKAFNDKVGNCAELNFLLIAALREVGVQADPVILSTRDHGRVHPVYPIRHKYNYVIACATIDGKDILLDATDKFIGFGQLPVRCLNFQGRLISENNSRWIQLSNLGESTMMFQAKLNLEECGTLSGSIEIASSGYDAVNKRRELLYNQDDYIKKLKDEKKSWEIMSHNFENIDKLSERLLSKYEVRITDAAIPAGNTIFIHPLLTEGWNDNPFKQEKRIFPIDLVHPSNTIFHLSLNIPEGYDVEEMPKSAMWALPENGGTFSYNVLRNGNTINITANFNLRKAFFGADTYHSLKEFYNLIVAKSAEQIVLKKKA